jgi:hypothetical protein
MGDSEFEREQIADKRSSIASVVRIAALLDVLRVTVS